MALLAAPLSVITVRDADGRRRGFTASSVTSVSLHPPLLLVGLSNDSSCRRALDLAAEFAINVLVDGHQEVARSFSTRDVDRFAGHPFDNWPDSDLPYLAGAAVAIRCAIADRIPVGDHQLVIGSPVAHLTDADAGRPLLWYQRGYCTAEPARPTAAEQTVAAGCSRGRV
jgi:flavin reductase ActVB